MHNNDEARTEQTPQKPERTKNIAKKYTMLRAANYRCHYCRTPLTMDTLTMDHMTPKVCGGTDDDDNLVASCVECNGLKGAIPYEVFVIAMASGNIDTLSATHKQLTNNVVNHLNHSKNIAYTIANRASIIRAIAKHITQGYVTKDILNELDKHVEEIQLLKNKCLIHAQQPVPDIQQLEQVSSY